MQVLSKIKANDECCVCLRRILGLQEGITYNETHLLVTTIEIFALLKVAQLLSFIVACDKEYSTKSKLPNKGKLIDTIAGVKKLIKVAHDSRLMPNYIKVE